jgi:hypothetical protein
VSTHFLKVFKQRRRHLKSPVKTGVFVSFSLARQPGCVNFSRTLREDDTFRRTGGGAQGAKILLISIFLLFLAAPNRAHQTSDSYLALSLTSSPIEGRWAIALRDLNHVLEIDQNKDGEVSDEELKNGRSAIEKYSFERLKISSDGKPLKPASTGFEIQHHDDAVYAALLFNLDGPVGSDLLVNYTIFNDTDPLHRGLFRLDLPKRTATTIFSPRELTQRFFLQSSVKAANFTTFLREGIWHIWIGFDHILFLLALLLPSVLRREAGRWVALDELRPALLNVVKVVTAFTIAHSITLTLATLGWVKLPSRLVESAIAASIIVAALNNTRPFLEERLWPLAFGFGLIHGFGFAGVLEELHLSSTSLATTLLGFNLGVELGQLAIVAIFIPIAFAFRRKPFYARVIVQSGSLCIAIIAFAWMLERVFAIEVLPF